CCHFLLRPLPHPPTPTLSPYTTLFRSPRQMDGGGPAPPRPAPRGVPERTGQRSRSPARRTGSSPSTARRRPPGRPRSSRAGPLRSEEHTSELQSRSDLVCRLLLEKKKN